MPYPKRSLPYQPADRNSLLLIQPTKGRGQLDWKVVFRQAAGARHPRPPLPERFLCRNRTYPIRSERLLAIRQASIELACRVIARYCQRHSRSSSRLSLFVLSAVVAMISCPLLQCGHFRTITLASEPSDPRTQSGSPESDLMVLMTHAATSFSDALFA